MKPKNCISGDGFYFSNDEIFIGSDEKNFLYLDFKTSSGLIRGAVEDDFILEDDDFVLEKIG